MESLSRKPFAMMMQTGKYWVTDNLSLFLRGIPMGKTTHFSCCLFQVGGGVSENGNCFLILRLPDASKNIPVFLEAIFQHLKKRKKSLPGRCAWNGVRAAFLV